jgi:signal transduction histidine kinase
VIIDEEGYVIYPKSMIAEYPQDFILLTTSGYSTTATINNQKVYISYPIQLSAPDITIIALQSIPLLFIIVTAIVLMIIAIYMTLYRKEKEKLDVLFELTGHRESSEKLQKLDLHIRIKEYAEIEEQVRKLYADLESSQKKIEKEMNLVKELERNNVSLLNGITHEMKTPLMSTKLLIDQLQLESLGTINQSLVSGIWQQTHNLEQLIQEILFITQRKTFYISERKAPVTPILTKVLANYDVLLEDKEIQVKQVLMSEFHMKLDDKLIEKILSNFLSNAVHYTLEKTTITVQVSDNRLKIMNSISDNQSIDLDDIGKPFVSFGTSGGTGLGLYLIKTMLANSPYQLTVSISEKNIFIAEIYLDE